MSIANWLAVAKAIGEPGGSHCFQPQRVSPGQFAINIEDMEYY